MPSERVQRRLDGLLDRAEAAVEAMEWDRASEAARAVLAIDPENDDARAFMAMVKAATGQRSGSVVAESSAMVTQTTSPAIAGPSAIDAPTSFANDRYQVSKFLGEGGKKRVYLAHDTLLDREVALALIKTEGFDETARSRITREAQAMGRLGTHPNIVTVFDLGVEGDEPYMVTELMGGGDVEGVLESEEDVLPLERVIDIAKAVCEGLQFAHERDVVHRDLKPGNVWLTDDGTAKIGDFGLAVMTDRSRLTREGMMVGTVSYMPPEQATGGEITPRADLYSLGAMLYEMVTGRPPFLGDDDIAIIGQHINTAPVAPTWHNGDCPRPLEALIVRLLSKDPAERPDSAQDVFNALDAINLTARGESVEQDVTSLESLAGGVFVGRQAEMDQLKAALEEVLGGRGRLVTLVGEPGIGKTRTSEELATYAGLRGAQVLWGRCYETGGQPPYWPWVQAIRSYVREVEPDELRRQMGSSASVVAEIVTDVKDRLPETQPPPQLDDPDSARFRLFDSITSFLKTASQSQPLVLILDDLHWSDGPSLTFLEFVAREIGQSRLLVVGTYRDMELNRRHPLTVTLGDLARERLYERVLLRGLARQDVARFIEIAAGVQPPQELTDTVHRHTEGNPLFVTEVVRDLVQSGELAENVFSGSSTWSVRIPEGVREVIGRRLDRLSERANEILTVAAVVGRDFRLGVMKELAEDTSEGQLLDVLDEALDARIIEELSDEVGHYQFTHALMQETLTGELSLTRRVRLHARIAETLERIYGEKADEHAAELAHHFGEAEAVVGTENLVHYSLVAGQRALASSSFDEARAHCERALEADDGSDPYRAADIQLALARAQAGSLDRQDIQLAVDNLMRAFDFFYEKGMSDRAIDAALSYFPRIHGPVGLADIMARATELAAPASSEMGILLVRSAFWASFERADAGFAFDRLSRAAALIELRADPDLELEYYAVSGTLSTMHLRFQDAVQFFAIANEIAEKAGNPGSQAQAGDNGSQALVNLWRLPEAVNLSEKAVEVAQRNRLSLPLAWLMATRGDFEAFVGDWDRARGWNDQAREFRPNEMRVAFARMLIEAQTGDLDAGAKIGAELIEANFRRQTSEIPQIGPITASLASFGRITQDFNLFAATESVTREYAATETIEPYGRCFAKSALVMWAEHRGDVHLARTLYRDLADVYAGTFQFYLKMAGDRILGIAATVAGEVESAAIHFENALRLTAEGGFRVELAWTCSDYAEMLLDRDNDGDREKAIELQDEALAITRELGMRPLTERILARREILRA